jgi:hypothetical protein
MLLCCGLRIRRLLNLKFQAVSAEVSFNGMPAANIDVSVDLRANTADLVTGGGYAGSDRYLKLKALFSSKALGLSDVEAATPLDVHIGATASNGSFKGRYVTTNRTTTAPFSFPT